MGCAALHGLPFVAAIVFALALPPQGNAGEVPTGLTLNVVARDVGPLEIDGFDDQPSIYELYDYGDLGELVGAHVRPDDTYQEMLDRAVSDSRRSQVSQPRGDAREWAGSTGRGEMPLRDRQSASRQY